MSTDQLLQHLRLSYSVIYRIGVANDGLENARNDLKEAVEYTKRKYKTFPAVRVIGMWIISVVILFQLWPLIESGWMSSTESSDLVVMPVIVLLILSFTWGFKHVQKKSAALQAEIAEFTTNILPEKEAAVPEKTKELQEICATDDVKFMMDFIPAQYATLDAVNYFIHLVENKRAETLKEAINLYEDNKYKEELLALQETNIQLLNQQIQEQKEHFNKQEKLQHQALKQQQQLIYSSHKISKQVRFGNVVSIIDTVRQWNR